MRIFPKLSELGELIGQEVAVGDWLEIDQTRIDGFAEATDDRQWIHVDVERAQRESPYKATIAHGFLTLSMLPYLLDRELRFEGIRLIVNHGLSRVRFPGAVKAGSRVRARIGLAEYKATSAGAHVEWLVTVEREGEVKPACVAGLLIWFYT
ncbi:MAG TPA: MaoC family dehydratase [Steroidobacteraceae bacterium]|nr:MaoC family dehydratase [Steroidobacteraceae bacterium]